MHLGAGFLLTVAEKLTGLTHCNVQIAPALLGGFKRAVEKFVQTMAWLDALAWFSGNISNDATEEAFDNFYAQNGLIPEYAPLIEKFVRAYFETCGAQVLTHPKSVLTSPARSRSTISC
jgi:hypothetical protein